MVFLPPQKFWIHAITKVCKPPDLRNENSYPLQFETVWHCSDISCHSLFHNTEQHLFDRMLHIKLSSICSRMINSKKLSPHIWVSSFLTFLERPRPFHGTKHLRWVFGLRLGTAFGLTFFHFGHDAAYLMTMTSHQTPWLQTRKTYMESFLVAGELFIFLWFGWPFKISRKENIPSSQITSRWEIETICSSGSTIRQRSRKRK